MPLAQRADQRSACPYRWTKLCCATSVRAPPITPKTLGSPSLTLAPPADARASPDGGKVRKRWMVRKVQQEGRSAARQRRGRWRPDRRRLDLPRRRNLAAALDWISAKSRPRNSPSTGQRSASRSRRPGSCCPRSTTRFGNSGGSIRSPQSGRESANSSPRPDCGTPWSPSTGLSGLLDAVPAAKRLPARSMPINLRAAEVHPTIASKPSTCAECLQPLNRLLRSDQIRCEEALLALDRARKERSNDSQWLSRDVAE